MKRCAYAYIDKSEAGPHLEWCECDVRSTAKAERLDLARTVIGGRDGRGLVQLFDLVSADPDATVILPSTRHFPADLREYADLLPGVSAETFTPALDALGEYADVVTVVPRRRWTKRRAEVYAAIDGLASTRHEVSDDTRNVPVVADLRADIEEAERQYRKVIGK